MPYKTKVTSTETSHNYTEPIDLALDEHRQPKCGWEGGVAGYLGKIRA